MGKLASSLSSQGKHAEAEQMLAELIDVERRVLGPEHPITLGTMGNLAAVLNGQDQHAEAEQMQRELLDVERRVLGPEHPDTLATMGNLAVSLNGQGKHAEAEQMLAEATGAWTGASSHAGYCKRPLDLNCASASVEFAGGDSHPDAPPAN
jgi:hypothetical protein